MRINVLKSMRLKWCAPSRWSGLAGLAAGCSSDVVRFDDGFYTGAVPQAPLSNQMAAASQPYPGDVDAMNTGSVSPARRPMATAHRRRGIPAQNQGSYRRPRTAIRRAAWPPRVPCRPASCRRRRRRAMPPHRSRRFPLRRARPQCPQPAAHRPRRWRSRAAPRRPPQSRPMQSALPRSRARSAAASGSVKVESGDLLLGIARRTGVSVADIKRANGMSDDTIRIGQTLTLPAGASAPSARAPSPRPRPRRSVGPSRRGVQDGTAPKS